MKSFRNHIDALELRIKLMRKLGATDEEVDGYRGQYGNFKNVREYFYNKAEQENNIEEQIRILTESKKLDKDSEYRVHRYSEELIEIYHKLGDYDNEKKNDTKAISIIMMLQSTNSENIVKCVVKRSGKSSVEA